MSLPTSTISSPRACTETACTGNSKTAFRRFLTPFERPPRTREFFSYHRFRSRGHRSSFPSLSVVADHRASESIKHAENPKIIIAGAGMSHGGRIRRHEAIYLPEKTTTLLLVGYQTPGSLGRRLMDGAKKIDIDGRA